MDTEDSRDSGRAFDFEVKPAARRNEKEVQSKTRNHRHFDEETKMEHGWSRRVHGKDGQSTLCSFCDHPIKWTKYADHLEKVHPGGAPGPRPKVAPKSMDQLLLEGRRDGDLLASR